LRTIDEQLHRVPPFSASICTRHGGALSA
jgi:hypothetical protein